LRFPNNLEQIVTKQHAALIIKNAAVQEQTRQNAVAQEYIRQNIREQMRQIKHDQLAHRQRLESSNETEPQYGLMLPPRVNQHHPRHIESRPQHSSSKSDSHSDSENED